MDRIDLEYAVQEKNLARVRELLQSSNDITKDFFIATTRVYDAWERAIRLAKKRDRTAWWNLPLFIIRDYFATNAQKEMTIERDILMDLAATRPNEKALTRMWGAE